MGDGSTLPPSPPVASITGSSAAEPKKANENAIDAVLFDPKKDLRELISIIASRDASLPDVIPEGDESRDEDTTGSLERTPTVATEMIVNLKQVTVRRENACGLLCMMVRSSSAKTAIGHTRGVIPALSAALVDKNASTEQKHRCLKTLILLSQDKKVRSIMLQFKALPDALKAAVIDESPQVRQLVCSLLVNLNKDKANRIIVGQFFLDRSVHIIELASAFDDILPRRGGRRLDGSELTTVLSDMTMDRCLEDDGISANDATCVAGNLSYDKEVAVTAPNTHDVYFQARSSALKVLLDLSNVPKLTTIMARHDSLVASLLRQVGHLKASANVIVIAILTNLTRHPANNIYLAGNGSFVTVLINEISNSDDDDRRKCALNALRNLTVEQKAQGMLITNTRLLWVLSSQYSEGNSSEIIRIEILRVLQNLSNDPSFLLRMPDMLMMGALISTTESSATPNEEKHLARDILASLSKWAWSSAHTAALAKAIYLGEDLGKAFGLRNPGKPLIGVRRSEQWE